jgi:hypothetical protein
MDEGMSEPANREPVFSWNECIELTDTTNRGVIVALSAVFDVIQALRADLAAARAAKEGGEK